MRQTAAAASCQSMPTRRMPVSTLTWTGACTPLCSARALSSAANASSVTQALTRCSRMASMSAAGTAVSRKMGLRMPAHRSSTASSVMATPKTSTPARLSAWQTTAAPWP